jgi:hypothetical protein
MLGQRQTRGRMGASPGGLVLMPSDVVRFGDDFELDRRAYELRHSGRSTTPSLGVPIFMPGNMTNLRSNLRKRSSLTPISL